MKFFGKRSNSKILQEGWTYTQKTDHQKIRRTLREEQLGFCAYSEKVLYQSDAADIEHFDPRLKKKPEDGYENWYYVDTQIHRRKKTKIEKYLPIHEKPCQVELSDKICYRDGQFVPVDPDDTATRNLLLFIGANLPEIFADRAWHVARIAEVRKSFGDDQAFVNFLRLDKKRLSFISALETDLELELLEVAREAREPQL